MAKNLVISDRYFQALNACTEHHETSKTFSGIFTTHHVEPIRKIISQLGITSILDYGCGKGKQYFEWLSPEGTSLEQVWGVKVTKYDPAWHEFSEMPKGTFDLVICSQVLCWIPPETRGLIMERLFELANKAVYIAEQMGPIKKQVVPGQKEWEAWSVDRWEDEVAFATTAHRDHTKRGFFARVEKINGGIEVNVHQPWNRP